MTYPMLMLLRDSFIIRRSCIKKKSQLFKTIRPANV